MAKKMERYRRINEYGRKIDKRLKEKHIDQAKHTYRQV